MADNGKNPAFPVFDAQAPASDFPWVCGLTKREAFAMAAMQGILANTEFGKQMRQSTDIIVGDTVSRLSMQCADSMLAELAKDPT